MTKRRRAAIAGALLTFAVPLSFRPTVVQAEFVNEFEFPEVRPLSQQASSKFLRGIEMMFRALALAEQGDKGGAEGMKKEGYALLSSSRLDFQRIQNEMKERKIDLGKAPRELNKTPIGQLFARRQLKIPETTTDLATIARSELDRLITALAEVNLSDRSSGRSALLRFNDQLHRSMELGIAISQLGEAAS